MSKEEGRGRGHTCIAMSWLLCFCCCGTGLR